MATQQMTAKDLMTSLGHQKKIAPGDVKHFWDDEEVQRWAGLKNPDLLFYAYDSVKSDKTYLQKVKDKFDGKKIHNPHVSKGLVKSAFLQLMFPDYRTEFICAPNQSKLLIEALTCCLENPIREEDLNEEFADLIGLSLERGLFEASKMNMVHPVYLKHESVVMGLLRGYSYHSDLLRLTSHEWSKYIVNKDLHAKILQRVSVPHESIRDNLDVALKIAQSFAFDDGRIYGLIYGRFYGSLYEGIAMFSDEVRLNLLNKDIKIPTYCYHPKAYALLKSNELQERSKVRMQITMQDKPARKAGSGKI